MPDLSDEFKKNVEGEVRFDKYSRMLYSTDASIYQIEPMGVVIPKHKDDVVTAMNIAKDRKVPVLPRGAGTSLAGQAIGEAVIIDMSKYMDKILELNREERWVRVQPGVVLDELNVYLKTYNLMFAPDVATSDRANIGGMIGNNSSGAHSIIYGKTVDYTQELSVVLSNGKETVFKGLSEVELRDKMSLEDLEGHVYREVRRIVQENKEEILRSYPKILRRVGGYNLDEFIDKVEDRLCDKFNLSKIVVGSEGTLATVVEAKIGLVEVPQMTALDIVHFETLTDSMEAVETILESAPSAVELVDKTLLDLAKGSLEYSRRRTFVQGDPGAILIVEFYGTSQDELKGQLDGLEGRLESKNMGSAFVRAIDPQEQNNVWNVRKAGLGLFMSMKGDTKPIPFVEDTAVSPEKLPDYVRKFDKIIEKYGTTSGYYAHASVGCLHIRPLINLKDKEQIENIRSIADEISDLVLEFGGSMSAEHGDGLARSCWNQKMFGPALYGAFKEVKAAFDPDNIMNPGKIVYAEDMNENLRFGADYKTIQIDTYFDFSADGGFDLSVELCNGSGACRKKIDGTMCPSFMATKEEEHSTRGRANALRAVLSGRFPHEEFTSKRLFDVLDLCLECKGCKAECPSNVDMAKLKYEFLAHYYKKNGLPLRNRLFGNIAALGRFGSTFAPLSNWIAKSYPSKWAMEVLFGIDSRRDLPPFASKTFSKWFDDGKFHTSGEKSQKRDLGTVVLFNDSFMEYNYPEIGKAAVYLMERAGFRVILPQKVCCGRPMISKGMIDKAIENAEYNVSSLYDYVQKGYKIVGCEPSCVSVIRDDYLDLVKDQKAKEVARNTYMIEEFLKLLVDEGELGIEFKDVKKKILLHGHCHQKALIGSEPSIEVLSLPPGYEVVDANSGCCGMAGSFGYESEHYDISMKIGELDLFKTIGQTPHDFEIAASGMSCRHQIEDGTGRKTRHPVEILADAL